MAARTSLAILLNGPLGIGKSTLGEVLGEAIDRCVTLDGDRLSALNPPPADELGALHQTLALLVGHHLSRGYDRFVINHYWSSQTQMADLDSRLRAVAPGIELRWFRLTLPHVDNLRRITLRQSARAVDESAFEAANFEKEFVHLSTAGDELGEPFDVSAAPEVLAERMLGRLGLPGPSA